MSAWSGGRVGTTGRARRRSITRRDGPEGCGWACETSTGVHGSCRRLPWYCGEWGTPGGPYAGAGGDENGAGRRGDDHRVVHRADQHAPQGYTPCIYARPRTHRHIADQSYNHHDNSNRSSTSPSQSTQSSHATSRRSRVSSRQPSTTARTANSAAVESELDQVRQSRTTRYQALIPE